MAEKTLRLPFYCYAAANEIRIMGIFSLNIIQSIAEDSVSGSQNSREDRFYADCISGLK